MTDPVITAVDNMIELVARVAERGIVGMVNDLIQSTIEMHAGMLSMVEKIKAFRVKSANYKVQNLQLKYLSFGIVDKL